MTLLQALKELRVMAATGSEGLSGVGICGNLYFILHVGGAYSAVNEAMEDWVHNKNGFVPNNADIGKWEGANLNYRLSLINHMINKLED